MKNPREIRSAHFYARCFTNWIVCRLIFIRCCSTLQGALFGGSCYIFFSRTPPPCLRGVVKISRAPRFCQRGGHYTFFEKNEKKNKRKKYARPQRVLRSSRAIKRASNDYIHRLFYTGSQRKRRRASKGIVLMFRDTYTRFKWPARQEANNNTKGTAARVAQNKGNAQGLRKIPTSGTYIWPAHHQRLSPLFQLFLFSGLCCNAAQRLAG